jgi:hypothetical protein
LTKGELEGFEEMDFEEMLDISEILSRYMKLYNIIKGTKDNFSNERNLIDKFNRCLTKNMVESNKEGE